MLLKVLRRIIGNLSVLFKSMVENILLYLSAIWDGPYTKQIKTGRLMFFKNHLKLLVPMFIQVLQHLKN